LIYDQIDVGEDGHWLVHDEQGDFTVSRSSSEEINRVHASKSTLCPLVCDICNVCVHTFTCTCMDYQLQNTVCKHIHAVVQLCGDELDGLMELPSVVDFKHEPADSSFNIQPEESSAIDTKMMHLVIPPKDSSTKVAEMDISLEVECESINDSEGQLKKIDELMNTIRGSLVASLDRNLFDTANERYETLAAQIYAATTINSSEASTNP